MFCDLVGSTSISAELDAEDWRDLVGAYLNAASAAVTEMGGHVAKKLVPPSVRAEEPARRRRSPTPHAATVSPWMPGVTPTEWQ
jgi:hypothetical protein